MQNFIYEKLISKITLFVTFLVPFFFLPFTIEYFEFNKLYLIAFATLAMLSIWAIRIITTKDLNIVKSQMDLSIILLLGAVILSTVFSINKLNSIYGAGGRWFPTLISYATLVIFYYVVSANVSKENSIKNILNALVAGTTIAVFAGLFFYFDTQIIKSNFLNQLNFSLTGSKTSLAVLSVAVVGIYLNSFNTYKNPMQKALLTIVAILNIFSAIVFGSNTITLLLALIVILAIIFQNKELLNKESTPYMTIVVIFSVILVLFLNVPSTKSVFVNPKYPNEPQLSLSQAWNTSVSSLRDFPITGSGPSTYYLNYSRYKSPSQNYTPNWNVKFDKPNNEIFNVIATMGILGTVAFLYFFVSAFRFAINNKNELSNSIAILQITALGSFVLSYGTITSAYLLFLGLALQSANLALINSKKARKVSLILSTKSKSFTLISEESPTEDKKHLFETVTAIAMLGLSIFGAYVLIRYYMGEHYVRKALNDTVSNNGKEVYLNLTKAIQINPRNDSYHNLLAKVSIALANNIQNQNKDTLAEEDKKTIQNLVQQAVQSSKIATEVLNPLNADNWATRAWVYGSLRNATNDAYALEVQSYNTAIRLDPTNPALRVAAGAPYLAKKEYLAAGNLFSQAISLKNDYANARFNLANALFNLEAFDKAKEELLIAQKLLDKNSQDYKLVVAELNKVDAVLEQKNTQQPQAEPTNAEPQNQINLENVAGANDDRNPEKTESPNQPTIQQNKPSQSPEISVNDIANPSEVNKDATTQQEPLSIPLQNSQELDEEVLRD